MKIHFADFVGPSGPYVATGDKMLSVASHAGATAVAASAIQAGTIDPDVSDQIYEVAKHVAAIDQR